MNSKRRKKHKLKQVYWDRRRAVEHKRLERQRSEYPRFILHPGKAPKPLVDSLREVLQHFDWDRSELINPGFRKVYRLQRQYGWQEALERCGINGDMDAEKSPEDFNLSFMLHLLPGQQMVYQLPENIKTEYLLFHDVSLAPQGKFWRT